ncbi:FtsX-like permease family protein [Clostridium sp. CCUG 7971]|uniref:ABC transporter permease n=1 Tax=Clostridium sp. CCUG 7971 TaxID=2811414 RepID=UPI001ABA67CB|nr:FtsX-like permease family protein [Clostridium sp. CCUG 7971]MBO3446040.1 ABC transporter permease [Clostridium sp. CCUG 7971]
MNLVKSTLANLKGHKLRVFVTLLWIIMGITSVILVSSIGNGLKKEVETSVNKVNPNKARIHFEPADYSMTNMSIFLKPFTSEDIEQLSFTEGVEKIGPSKDDFDFASTYSNEATYDKKTTYVDIADLKKDTKLNPIYGRSFSLDDANRKVIIITMQNATDLFDNPERALGKGISINGTIYEIIGIVDESSVSNKSDENKSIYNMNPMEGYVTSYMPKKALDGLINQYNYSQEIYALDLVVSKGYDVFEVANNIIGKLSELHPDINGSYKTDDPSESTQELHNMISTINKFVTLITAISMFVGGIGVMNIMYVSVMERQREIGIRRAIGAKPRTIMFQFLVEAVFITVCGGILGIIVGFIVVNYASNYLPFKAIPNINSFFFASITTVVTGVIFGIIPAFKASRLDPIKAIYK